MKCKHGEIHTQCRQCWNENTAEIHKPTDQREAGHLSAKEANFQRSVDSGLNDLRMEKKKGSALSTQVGGDHYKSQPIQPVQYIEANKLQFLEGCVVKRVTRHDKPTGKGRQDIEKAIHELQLLLELRYGPV